MPKDSPAHNVPNAFYGINRPENADVIRDLIAEKGLSCGVYMAYFLLKALCRMGYLEEAYRLIVNTGLCHPWASAPISVLAEDILPALPKYGRIVHSLKRKDRSNP